MPAHGRRFSSEPLSLAVFLLSSSRSSRFLLKITLAAGTLTAVAALVAGCTSLSASSDFAAAKPNPLDDDGTGSGAPTAAATDASVAKTTPYRGNPLCRVTDGASCMPDDDGYRRTIGTSECALPSRSDGGDSDGGPAEIAGNACRIGRESGVITSTCKEGEAGGGMDGSTCDVGADCAAGFDCIAGEKRKVCRHYCCTGSCKAYASQNGSATFCDVQPLVDVNQKAPVCMPLKRCTLLGAGECTTNETCAVVTETGDSGCVTIGDKQVGASCDEDHCAAKLTCIGQPGSRKCFKLCQVNASDCGPALVCATSTIFKDPDFGICQKP
jgi:hypothetical protein